MLLQIQPILPTKYVQGAVEFYVEKLGFKLVHLEPNKPAYAVIQRDQVELHLQWHDAKEWELGNRPMLRILVSELEHLFHEFSKKNVFHEETALRKTAWSTEEFGFYDCDGNGLIFYRPL
jgi:catechol 2,3-dioxygenase-like lactoylglutathione lyase family enzyme